MKTELARTSFVTYLDEIIADKYNGDLQLDSFDYDDFVNNIDDETKSREYLNVLYNKMNRRNLNKIFFNVVIIAYEHSNLHTHLIKTSLISIVSNKSLKVLS